MAHAANILDFRVPQTGRASIVVPPVVRDVGPARLIPGMQALQQSNQRFPSTHSASGQVLQSTTVKLKQAALFLLPEFLKSFLPPRSELPSWTWAPFSSCI